MALYSSVDALITATLPLYAQRKMADNVFDAIPLLFWLQHKGRMVPYPGGSKILEPVLTARSSNTGWIGGYDSVPTTQQQGKKLAEYDWRVLAGSVVLSELDRMRNSGESAVMNMLQNEIDQCEATLRDDLSTALHGSGTDSGNAIIGLQTMIDATTTPLGGLPVASYPTWISYEAAVGGALAHSHMRTLKNTLVTQQAKIDCYVTGLTPYAAIEGLIGSQQRFTNAVLASAGFENIAYGGAPVMLDGDTVAQVLYAIDSSAMGLRPHSECGKGFKVYGPLQESGKFVKTWLFAWVGALTCRRRRALGKLTGITG